MKTRCFLRKFSGVLLAATLIVAGCGRRSSEKILEPAAPPVISDGMVFVRGGKFLMGDENGMPSEAPVHEVEVGDFWLDETEVTVRQFAAFVDATGYVTEAEKFGWSGVFNLEVGRWERVDGANWKFPEGPSASAAASDEPVCQVSWNDAAAYAKWAGKRLPTEAEFEYAARAGLSGKTYAWGDELLPGGRVMANYWQGEFPSRNTVADGFRGRAPVRKFPANAFGFYDLTGNVWEWTADWYDAQYFVRSPKTNPTGPETGGEKSIRGGSFLCAENFCSNYRVAGRSQSPPDSGLNNLGFRCARSAL